MIFETQIYSGNLSHIHIKGGATEKFFLDKDSAALLIIDIQEKLTAVMKTKEEIIKNCIHLIELSKTYNLPIILTEQYPKGLGQTVEEIRVSLPYYIPIEKFTFNCCDEPSFLNEITAANRRNIVVTGMEAHVCVLQTCLGLLQEGHNVHVVKDAVCARSKDNWETGIEFMRDAGAVITSTETVLFQVLRIAGTEEFRAISRRIK
ncbi:MAG: hydrolase [Nitrospirota bacterium]